MKDKIILLLTIGILIMQSLFVNIDAEEDIDIIPTRGIDGWTPLDSGNSSFFIDSENDHLMTFDNVNDEISFGKSYDPYFSLDQTIRKAVDRVPLWLNDTLVWSILNIYPAYRMKFVNILLNESIDSRYLDEIAFTLAYTPSTFMNQIKVEGKVLWENVHMMYTVSDDVKYASISDYNLTDGQHSTITYRLPSGNVTMPENIYYWYVVMPKCGSDNMEYLNPDTLEFDYSYEGGEFWRTYLYYNNESGYPLLKDSLSKVDYLWKGGRNNWTDNGAVGAVTKWEMDSVRFGMPSFRYPNPIYIYKTHIGMCGENAYILAGIAKIALIPTVMTLTWEGNHAWNDFWERGWHQWEAYSGQIDNPSCEGRSGAVNAFTSNNPDFSHFSLNRCYTTTSNLTVRVKDRNGAPVDGVLIKLHSGPVPDEDGSLGLISNLTDVKGETTFEVGSGFPYFITYRAPIGGPPDQNGYAIPAFEKTIQGKDHFFNLTLNASMPVRMNYSKNYEEDHGLMFTFTADKIDHLTKFHEDDRKFNVEIWKDYKLNTRLSILFLDDQNLGRYKRGQEFFAGGVLNISEGNTDSIILKDMEWNIVVSGKGSPLTRSFANINVAVKKSFVSMEAAIISPKDGSTFSVLDQIKFKGDLDFFDGDPDSYQYNWYDRRSGGVVSNERVFTKYMDAGEYIVDFEVLEGGVVISKDSVSFDVYQPNRPPSAMISSPKENSRFEYGTRVQFSAAGSYDIDEDALSYEWKEIGMDQFLSDMKEFSAVFNPGIHTIELTVNDGRGLTSKTQTIFSIGEENLPPVPTIHYPQSTDIYMEDQFIELNANGTYDPNGDELEFTWISSIDGVISKNIFDSVKLSPGHHYLAFYVEDVSFNRSAFVDFIVNHVIPEPDSAPVAMIDSPIPSDIYYISNLLNFSAASSYDPDGDAYLSYLWKIDHVNVSREREFETTLSSGLHFVELTVYSGDLSDTIGMEIEVRDRNPYLKVMVNETLIVNDSILYVLDSDNITLDGSFCFDPDGGELSFNWSIDGKPVSRNVSFVHTFEAGSYLVRLDVADTGGNERSYVIYINSVEVPGKIIEDDDDEEEEPVEELDQSEGKNEGLPVVLFIFPLVLLVIIGAVIFLLLARRKRYNDENGMDNDEY